MRRVRFSGEPCLIHRTPFDKRESGGDGVTVDAMGRWYVTSALGIQMFDWTGRIGGVIARPQTKGTVSMAFAGPKLEYLYACSPDKVCPRKMKTPGAWLFPKGR